MKKQVRSKLLQALLYFLFSAGFLALGYSYPVSLIKRYGENDFRGGGALMIALIAGVVYGVRAMLALFDAVGLQGMSTGADGGRRGN